MSSYQKGLSAFALIFLSFLIFVFMPEVSCGQVTGQQISNYPNGVATFSWQDEVEEDRKDPVVATRKALLHTFAPVGAGIIMIKGFDQNLVETAGAVLIGYGLVYGPSQGNLYAEDTARGMTGVGIRAASVALTTFVSLSATSALIGDVLDNFEEGENNESDYNYNAASAVILLSGVAFTGSMVYNLLTADKSAREYNEKFVGDLEVSLKSEHLRYTNQSAPALTVRLNF